MTVLLVGYQFGQNQPLGAVVIFIKIAHSKVPTAIGCRDLVSPSHYARSTVTVFSREDLFEKGKRDDLDRVAIRNPSSRDTNICSNSWARIMHLSRVADRALD